MNKEWSELNKTMQAQIKKEDTYEAGTAMCCITAWPAVRRSRVRQTEKISG